MDLTTKIKRCHHPRSRSVTPVHGSPQVSGSKARPSYRQAKLMSLVKKICDIRRENPSPSRKKLRVEGMPVHPVRRGSLRAVPEARNITLESTSKDLRLRRRRSPPPLPQPQSQPLFPICFEPLERAEAMDLSEEEAEEILSSHPGHLNRWVDKTPTRDSPATPSTPPREQPTPSTSGTKDALVAVNYGSDLDSDYDDEFDIQAASIETRDREIPHDEELPEFVLSELREFEIAMDKEVEQVAGSRASFDWEEDFDTYRGTREVFTGPTPGPVKDYDTAYDAFVDIWDSDIVGHIVTETNRYAKQTIDKKTEKGELKPQSRLRQWVDTDIGELYLLFAIHMLMGIYPRSSEREYWETNTYTSMSLFNKLMSYNRFILLNKFYHFVDNLNVSSGLRQNDEEASVKLSKLLPIIDHLNLKFSTLYNLHSEICVDESLTLFKGRLSWIQAISSKAARFGIKSFEVRESHTGYLHKFEIYVGKDSKTIATDLGEKSAQILLNLVKGLQNMGYLITMNNYYNSPLLARYLKSKGFDCLGTLRSNRKNVPDAIRNFPKNAPLSMMEWRHSGDVCTVAWKDVSTVVCVISTYHNNETILGTKAKPRCVGDYNRTMGGVDLINQKLSTFLLERKRATKWYFMMYKRLLNVSIHNAFIMFKESLKRRNLPFMTHRDFRKDLANELIARYRKYPKPVTVLSSIPDEDTRLRGDIVHSPNYASGRNNRKRCKVCYQMGVNKLVHMNCTTCQVFLCPGNCWNEWHTLKILKGNKRQTRPRPSK